MAYVVIDADEWKKALASEAATSRFLEEVMDKLDEAAETRGYCGPEMPWHLWLRDTK